MPDRAKPCTIRLYAGATVAAYASETHRENVMHRLIVAAVILLFAMPAFAAMQATPLEWKIGKQAFAGYVIYDDASKDERPGIVMVPNWMGVNAAAVEKAKRIAGDKYVVLLADVYGKGVNPKDHAEA